MQHAPHPTQHQKPPSSSLVSVNRNNFCRNKSTSRTAVPYPWPLPRKPKPYRVPHISRPPSSSMPLINLRQAQSHPPTLLAKRKMKVQCPGKAYVWFQYALFYFRRLARFSHSFATNLPTDLPGLPSTVRQFPTFQLPDSAITRSGSPEF